MKTYPKYKDSGVKGLEAIPSTWNIVRIKHTGTIRHGLSYTPSDICNAERGILVLRASNIQNGKLAFEDNVFVTPNIVPKEKRVQEGDIIMCSTNGSLELVGKCALIDRPLEASFGSFMLQYHPNCNSRYMYYQLSYLVNLYRGRFSTSTINQITMSMLGDIDAAMPPLAEQQAIAEYLDKKTGDIDELVGLLNKQIADVRVYRQSLITETVTQGLNKDVPMKDSGIKWIGQIPKAWKVLKLKHISEICGRIGYRGYTALDLVGQGEGAITLSPSNIQDNKMTYQKCSYLSWNKYEESPEIQVHNGDIIFTKTGSSYGKSAYVDYLPMEATINPQLIVIKCKDCNPKFISYILQTSVISSQVELSVVGGTIPTISQEAIGGYHLPIPSLSEQQQIVEFLDAKTKDIDELLSKLEAQVADLLAYKSSLISEVVTGKIDIR